MPSVSGKQHRLMAMVANNPKAAKRVGIPKSVGEEFMEADKGRKFGSGGTRAEQMAINNPKTNHGRSAILAKGGKVAKSESAAYMAKERKHVEAMKKAGVPKKIVKEEAEEAGMKRGGKVRKMAAGGYTREADGVAQRGKTRAMQVKMAGGKGMMRGGKC